MRNEWNDINHKKRRIRLINNKCYIKMKAFLCFPQHNYFTTYNSNRSMRTNKYIIVFIFLFSPKQKQRHGLIPLMGPMCSHRAHPANAIKIDISKKQLDYDKESSHIFPRRLNKQWQLSPLYRTQHANWFSVTNFRGSWGDSPRCLPLIFNICELIGWMVSMEVFFEMDWPWLYWQRLQASYNSSYQGCSKCI